MPADPTRSPTAPPTRLLLEDTVPDTPSVPSNHVTAPLAVLVVPLPLPHSGDKTTALPLAKMVTAPEPTSSPAAEPTKLLLLDSTPETPEVPLPQVMAPFDEASVAVVPPPQYCERTM